MPLPWLHCATNWGYQCWKFATRLVVFAGWKGAGRKYNTTVKLCATTRIIQRKYKQQSKRRKASQKARLCAYFNRTRSLEPKPFGNILQGVLVEQLLFTCQFIPRGKSPLRASRRKIWLGLQVILALMRTTAIVLTMQKPLLKTSRLPTTPSLFWAQGTW